MLPSTSLSSTTGLKKSGLNQQIMMTTNLSILSSLISKKLPLFSTMLLLLLTLGLPTHVKTNSPRIVTTTTMLVIIPPYLLLHLPVGHLYWNLLTLKMTSSATELSIEVLNSEVSFAVVTKVPSHLLLY